MNAENNHENYRHILKTCEPPSIPFVGLFLKDFSLISDGNVDTLRSDAGNNLINFDKRRKIAYIVLNLTKHQHVQYPYLMSAKLSSYFKALNYMPENVLIEKSMILEHKDD